MSTKIPHLRLIIESHNLFVDLFNTICKMMFFTDFVTKSIQNYSDISKLLVLPMDQVVEDLNCCCVWDLKKDYFYFWLF